MTFTKNISLVINVRNRLHVNVNWFPDYELTLERLIDERIKAVGKLESEISVKYLISFDLLALHFGVDSKDHIPFMNDALELDLKDVYETILLEMILNE